MLLINNVIKNTDFMRKLDLKKLVIKHLPHVLLSVLSILTTHLLGFYHPLSISLLVIRFVTFLRRLSS